LLRRSDHREKWAYAYLGPAALAMIVLVFVPFAVGAAMSLYHYDGLEWRFIGLGNFRDVLLSRDQPITDPLSFWFTLVVTALWTVANVSLHVTLGAALALALRDPLLKLRGVYRVLLIVPWAVPNYITALIWKGMFHRQFGAVNALLASLGLSPIAWFSRFWTAFTANLTTNVWLGFPFMMVTALGALSRIPKELEEAAALDGAGRLARLRHVILPLLRPAMLPAVVLGAVWTFNMFNVVFLVSGGEPDSSTDILVSQAYRWAFTRGHQYGYAAAYAVLIFIVLVSQGAIAKRLSPPEES
jgi:arabinogalactan oligomer/maltooligosaccharide transport system permease protein